MNGCDIWLDRRKHWDPKLKCATIIHEVGHLFGREHSENPRSIMAPVILQTTADRVC